MIMCITPPTQIATWDMPKLDRDKALRTLWLAECQEFAKFVNMLYHTNAPDDVWDSLMMNEPSSNFNEWKRQRALRRSL